MIEKMSLYTLSRSETYTMTEKGQQKVANLELVLGIGAMLTALGLAIAGGVGIRALSSSWEVSVGATAGLIGGGGGVLLIGAWLLASYSYTLFRERSPEYLQPYQG